AFTLPGADCTLYALDPGRPRTVAIYHAERQLAAVLRVRGDEPGPLAVRLSPAGAVAGRVVDGDGQPVAGARVIPVYRDGAGRELDRYLRRRRGLLQTDAEGRFRLDG